MMTNYDNVLFLCIIRSQSSCSMSDPHAMGHNAGTLEATSPPWQCNCSKGASLRNGLALDVGWLGEVGAIQSPCLRLGRNQQKYIHRLDLSQQLS